MLYSLYSLGIKKNLNAFFCDVFWDARVLLLDVMILYHVYWFFHELERQQGWDNVPDRFFSF